MGANLISVEGELNKHRGELNKTVGNSISVKTTFCLYSYYVPGPNWNLISVVSELNKRNTTPTGIWMQFAEPCMYLRA